MAVKGKLSESVPNQKQILYDNKPNHTAHTHTHTGKSTLYILKLDWEGKSLWKHQIVMRKRLSKSRRDRKEETERQRCNDDEGKRASECNVSPNCRCHLSLF